MTSVMGVSTLRARHLRLRIHVEWSVHEQLTACRGMVGAPLVTLGPRGTGRPAHLDGRRRADAGGGREWIPGAGSRKGKLGREMSTIRRSVTPLAVIAAAIVLYIEAPWETFGLGGFAPTKDLETILSIAFWVLAIVVALALFEDRKAPGATTVEVEGPAFTRFLFANTRAGLLWLPIRLFVGFSFLEAGLHKLFPAGKAMGAGWLDGGASLLGYWQNAVKIPDAPARPAITFEWYRDFLNILINNHAESWFAFLIVFGEIAVGLGLIFGALTGFAAFFGRSEEH